MKRNIISIIVSACIIIPLVTAFSGCSSGALFKNSAAVEKKIIKDEAYTVGSASQKGWQLDIQEGTFDNNKDLTMNVLPVEENRKYSGDTELIGSIVVIALKGEKTVRLNAPVTVKMKLPTDVMLSGEDFDNYVGAYYTGSGWEYIIPDAAQLHKGYISFETDHFSAFAAARLNDRQKTELYANKMAADSWYRETKEAALSEKINVMFTEALGKMGISDSTVKGKILRSIAKKSDYGSLLVSAEKGDLADFTAKCGEMAATSLIEVNSKLAGTGATVFSTSVKAGEKLYNGDYKGAEQEITNAFIGAFPAGKAFQAAVKLIDTGINLWTDSEVEAAYRAYTGQMEPGEYGYSVTKGDWDSLTAQMRGIAYRLENMEKERYCAVNNITRAQLDADGTMSEWLANLALSNLKKQFDARYANEQAIAERKAGILKQIESFEKEGFLTRGSLNYGYDTDVCDRLRTLFKVRDNILDIFDGTMPFDAGKGETPEANLKLAMGKWLSYGTKDRAEFYKWLKEKGWLKSTEKAASGKWVQTDFKQIAHQNVNDPNWQEVYTVSDGSISYVFTNSDGVDIKTASYWSGLKPSYAAGEKVELILSMKLENDKWNPSIYPTGDEAFAGIDCSYVPDQSSYSYSQFSNSSGINSAKCYVGKSGDADLTNPGETTTVSGAFPGEGKEGDEVAVIVESCKGCQAIYVYKWTAGVQ